MSASAATIARCNGVLYARTTHSGEISEAGDDCHSEAATALMDMARTAGQRTRLHLADVVIEAIAEGDQACVVVMAHGRVSRMLTRKTTSLFRSLGREQRRVNRNLGAQP